MLEQIRVDHLYREKKEKLLPIFKNIFYTEESDLTLRRIRKKNY